MKSFKINLGCGTDIRPGYVNVDKYRFGDNIVHDIDRNGLRIFKDEQADYIIMSHIIEHIRNYKELVDECNRVLNDKGVLEMYYPHYSSNQAYTDPTHINHFSVFTFEYYTNKFSQWKYAKKHFNRISKYIVFKKNPYIWNIIIEKIVNVNDFTLTVYEEIFAWVFPAGHCVIKLYKE